MKAYAIGTRNLTICFDVNDSLSDNLKPKVKILMSSFKVFKLVLDDQSDELVEEKEVKDIDKDVVFVGDNKTLAVPALDFPEDAGTIHHPN
ncbi:hypothetical protein QQP08_011439 [Theobroma cacao]|nr:hypothetical protein QQP08_011439 [Theobroma cacao]